MTQDEALTEMIRLIDEAVTTKEARESEAQLRRRIKRMAKQMRQQQAYVTMRRRQAYEAIREAMR